MTDTTFDSVQNRTPVISRELVIVKTRLEKEQAKYMEYVSVMQSYETGNGFKYWEAKVLSRECFDRIMPLLSLIEEMMK